MAETRIAHVSSPPRQNASYGPFARGLFGWLFRPVTFPPEQVDPLRALADKATLVYVLRSSALLHLLYFNWTFWRLGLPLARAATGLGYRVLQPLARWFLGGPHLRVEAVQPGQDKATAAVVAAARTGEAALVFLRQPRTLPSAVAAFADPFPALVALQRELAAQGGRPIALVPLTFLFRRRPRQLRQSLRDALFGDPESPGALRALVSFLLHRKTSFVKVGEPVLLADVVALQPDADAARVARRVRGFLHQHLARETRVVTGPPLKSAERVLEETLRDLTLRRAIEAVAKDSGRGLEDVSREAHKDLLEIAARYNATAISLFKRFLTRFVFGRIYEGFDVDERSVKAVVEASARAPLVLCPCHKSHLDYLILPVVCDDHGIQPPHVAAGDNLNFWPVGRLLRMGGAFFIRRSFKGDRIYQATLGAYVKKLLRDGFTQEFFVEGGRSRTGKLLPPKLGMIALEVDAWLTGVRPDVQFVPVNISYEKIAEERSYQHELLGGEKRKEDAKALLSATQVLRKRFGRISIRFDDPISLAQLFRERGVDPKSHDPEARRALVRALGLRVAAGINRAAPLAPMGLCCAVLLSHDRRGMSEDDLLSRAEFLHQAARDGGAHAPLWEQQGVASLRESGTIARAAATLVADGAVRVQQAGGERFFIVVEERRMALDYHKNAILHFLVAPAILASALRSFAGQPAPIVQLLKRAKELSRLFKNEFIYEPGRPFDDIVDDTFAHFLRWGLAEHREMEIVPTTSGARVLQLLAEQLRPFGEGLWAAVDGLGLLLPGPLDPKDWTKTALDRGRASYLAGRIRRIESLSKATLDNSLALLRERGVLAPGEGKGAKLALAPEWADEKKLATLREEIDIFLR